MVGPRNGASSAGVADIVLRVLAVAALAISAYVHFHLAHLYDSLGDTITMGALFRVQAAIATVVALWLLVTGNRFAWWAAALVGAASFAAVMTYRYVDVGAIGPIPNMYDASWYPKPDKALSAVAEAAVVVLWAAHEILARRSVRRRDERGRLPAGS